mmetsp:Transcript_88124/g.222441  ORF Transcript_88124/g.222441 Transcript_88124/m.222441 type:complete len:234 (-) Transcript_88124:16-717(-)
MLWQSTEAVNFRYGNQADDIQTAGEMWRRLTQNWLPQAILKGFFLGSRAIRWKQSSSAKARGKTRFTYVADRASPGLSMGMAACIRSKLTSPYQCTHVSLPPSTASSCLSVPLASCAKTHSNFSSLSNTSSARGCACCTHRQTEMAISSSDRGWKSAVLSWLDVAVDLLEHLRPILRLRFASRPGPKITLNGSPLHILHWRPDTPHNAITKLKAALPAAAEAPKMSNGLAKNN